MKPKHMMIITLAAAGLFIATNSFSAEVLLEQRDKSFQLGGKKVEEMTINVGDTIRFKNEDPFFHNIFSLSDLKTFDLGSFSKGNSKTLVFDKAGMAEVECAIHPEMYLEVTVK